MRSRWKAAPSSSIAASAALVLLVLCASPCAGGVVGSVAYATGGALPASALEGGSLLRGGDAFSDSLLAAELVRLDSLLFSYGHLGAAIAVDTVRGADRCDVRITVSEGERTAVGDVSVSGSTLFTPAEVIRFLGAETDGPFDPPAVGDAMERLLLEYNDAGFPYAQVWLTGFQYRSEGNRADLSFSIFEGDRAVIARVLFDGLTKTDTALALRTSRLREGEVYNEQSVRRSSDYLRLSDLFEDVKEAEVRRGRGGAVDIVLPVTERKRGNRFQGAFGFSRRDGGEYILNGSAEAELRNIAGTGRNAMFSWMNDGRDYSRIDVGYHEPFLFSAPVHLDVEVRQVVQDTTYTFHSGGLFLTIPIAPDLSALAGAAVDRNVPGAGDLVRSIRQRYRIGFEHRRGRLLNVRVHVEGAYRRSYLRGDRAERDGQMLYRLEGTTEIPTFRRQSFFFRLVSEAVFSSGEIPTAERFPLGGAKTLRGYRENQFRGERIIFSNIEYRFGGTGRIFVFDDIGWLYREEDDWSVKNGVGFGLRSVSPLGVIELSFAAGDRLSLEGTRIHVSLQEQF